MVTPVNVGQLRNLLVESGYDCNKTQFLVDGFTQGFDLGYRGPQEVKIEARNLKFTIGSKTEMWNKIMKEVENKRYAGPFNSIPFDHYIQSPIGLVPKDNGKKDETHFSPFHIPKMVQLQWTTTLQRSCVKVKYKDFDEAIRLCVEVMNGRDPGAPKSDLTSAFRHLPIKKEFWKFLVMKAQKPTGWKMVLLLW